MVEFMGMLARQAWDFNRPVMVTHEDLSDPFGRFTDLERDLVRELLRDRQELGLMAVPVGVGRELLGYVLLIRDVLTDPWTAEEQEGVMEVGRTLGRVVLNARLYERERHLVGELQELDRYKGELIATISHELKTPLTSIIGHVELLEDMDTGIGSVDAISRNAERLNRLVQNLLDYSQVQDKRETVRRPGRPAQACRAAWSCSRSRPSRAGSTMTLTIPDEPVMVTADPDELGKVIDNLASNAVKYTRPAAPCTRGRRRRRAREVLCADTGLGISTADQVHLFSAFHRSSNPEALSIPGTGLGLAISRRIAEMHGGEILVGSELGKGSTFRLRLPLLESVRAA